MRPRTVSAGVFETAEGFSALVALNVQSSVRLPPLDGTKWSLERREKARKAIEKRIEDAIRSLSIEE